MRWGFRGVDKLFVDLIAWDSYGFGFCVRSRDASVARKFGNIKRSKKLVCVRGGYRVGRRRLLRLFVSSAIKCRASVDASGQQLPAADDECKGLLNANGLFWSD